MFREYLMLLLLGHILGDFYIQTNKIARKKENSMKWVVIHSLYYFATMFLICLPILSFEIALGVILAAILHLIIDIFKFLYLRTFTKKTQNTQLLERNSFFLDQLFHILSLIGIAYCLVINTQAIYEWSIIKRFFDVAGISEVLLLSWILALLFIHKPANMITQKLLIIYRDNDKDKKNIHTAGKFIGTVERIIMLIFISIGQYSSIGLVLTAKSIARYDRISKDQEFAEYYLLGTLISTMIAIFGAMII